MKLYRKPFAFTGAGIEGDEVLTESDLYAMAMESETAHKHMAYLCAVLGFNFPPQLEPRAPSTMADPIPRHAH